MSMVPWYKSDMKWLSQHVNAIRNQEVFPAWNSHRCEFSHVKTPQQNVVITHLRYEPTNLLFVVVLCNIKFNAAAVFRCNVMRGGRLEYNKVILNSFFCLSLFCRLWITIIFGLSRKQIDPLSMGKSIFTFGRKKDFYSTNHGQSN